MLKFAFHGIKINTDLSIYTCTCIHVYMYRSKCVEVFEKTIRGTEIIDHSFKRKFYGV